VQQSSVSQLDETRISGREDLNRRFFKDEKMASSKTILGISDVSLGFGSPEIPALMASLARHYDTPAVVFEPDEITRPPLRQALYAGLSIDRIPSTWETYSWPYRVEYVTNAARRINKIRPDMLVIFCTYVIPVLFKLRYRPRFVIYHSYEIVNKYGQLDVEMNRHADALIDLIIFSEENRARIDISACGYRHAKKVLAYNCGDLVHERQPALPASARNGKIIYFGTLARHAALSGYFLDPRTQGIPIDLYGRVMEPNEELARQFLAGVHGSVRYHGLLEPQDLVRVRREYAYAVVLWNPTISDNHHYVSPNRLFTSIMAGVPPISAPHPQCKMMIERYDCGLLMDDWSYESFQRTLRKAMKIYGTSRYADLVANCQRAAQDDLNWDKQFAKIQRLLPVEL
jgi:hypothetical protein